MRAWKRSPVRLLIVLSAHVSNRAGWALLLRSLCSLRLFHPDARLHLVDNASPDPYAAQVRSFAAREQVETFCRHTVSGFEYGALKSGLDQAIRWNATHLVSFQHSMRLLRPLPLETLPCALTSFQTFPPMHYSGTQGILEQHVPNFMLKLVERQAPLLGSEAAGAVRTATHTYSFGFVCDHACMQQLARTQLFQIGVCSKFMSLAAERLIGIAAAAYADSPAERCNLDGNLHTVPRVVEKFSHVRVGRAQKSMASADKFGAVYERMSAEQGELSCEAVRGPLRGNKSSASGCTPAARRR